MANCLPIFDTEKVDLAIMFWKGWLFEYDATRPYYSNHSLQISWLIGRSQAPETDPK